MTDDPIVAEVRAVREQLAKRFDYDVEAIVRDVREREQHAVDRKVVCLSPRKPAGPPVR